MVLPLGMFGFNPSTGRFAITLGMASHVMPISFIANVLLSGV
jgi:hypothetical protein